MKLLKRMCFENMTTAEIFKFARSNKMFVLFYFIFFYYNTVLKIIKYINSKNKKKTLESKFKNIIDIYLG